MAPTPSPSVGRRDLLRSIGAGVAAGGIGVAGCLDNGAGVVDDFEDGDLAEYRRVRTDGEVGVVPATWPRRPETLRVRTFGAGATGVRSTDGLPRYPAAGDRFRVRFALERAGADGGFRVGFGVGDGGDRYRVENANWNDRLRLSKVRGDGTPTLLNQRSATYRSGAWHDLDVAWGRDGRFAIALRVEGETVATLGAVEDSIDSGGIELLAWSGRAQMVAHVDHVAVLGRA